MVIGKGNNGKTLKSAIYKAMLNDILTGVYRPEQPFTEKELVSKFNVSKSPIREALIELINEGMIRAIPRYGYEVLRIRSSQVEQAKQTRQVLECGAFDMYFDRITKDKIDFLYSIINEAKGKEHDILEHWDGNSCFHLALMDCYCNDYLSSMLSSVLNLMKIAYVQYQYDKWKNFHFKGDSHTHSDLLGKISSGDKNEAIRLLRMDIESFGIGVLD